MLRTILLFAGIFVSVPVFAAPNQIDVIGLIPDVSTSVEVEEAKKGEYGTFVIGGLQLSCSPDYIDKKLSQFFCLLSESDWQPLSNQMAFEVLNEGFTKKLGVPTKVLSVPVSNLMGAKFQQKLVTWRDKKGNKLTITNMVSDVKNGSLFLESATKIKEDKIKSQEKAKAIKF
jgi:hypothetical protein